MVYAIVVCLTSPHFAVYYGRLAANISDCLFFVKANQVRLIKTANRRLTPSRTNTSIGNRTIGNDTAIPVSSTIPTKPLTTATLFNYTRKGSPLSAKKKETNRPPLNRHKLSTPAIYVYNIRARGKVSLYRVKSDTIHRGAKKEKRGARIFRTYAPPIKR